MENAEVVSRVAAKLAVGAPTPSHRRRKAIASQAATPDPTANCWIPCINEWEDIQTTEPPSARPESSSLVP